MATLSKYNMSIPRTLIETAKYEPKRVNRLHFDWLLCDWLEDCTKFRILCLPIDFPSSSLMAGYTDARCHVLVIGILRVGERPENVFNISVMKILNLIFKDYTTASLSPTLRLSKICITDSC